MKLDPTDLTKFDAAIAQVRPYEQKISKRIHEVLAIICKCAGSELDWWDCGYYDNFKSLQEVWDAEGHINLYVEAKGRFAALPDKFSASDAFWPLLTEFDTNLLTMDDEEIRAIVKKKIDEIVQEHLEEQAAAERSKQEKKAKKAEVLAKLSPEERNALGL